LLRSDGQARAAGGTCRNATCTAAATAGSCLLLFLLLLLLLLFFLLCLGCLLLLQLPALCTLRKQVTSARASKGNLRNFQPTRK